MTEILFSRQRFGLERVINGCLQKRETEFLLRDIRHKGLSSGWALIQTTNTFSFKKWTCREKAILLWKGLQGLSQLLQDPAHYQEENNSAVMFRLTIVLRGKVKPCQLISMRRLQWRSRGVKAVSGSSPWLLFFNSLSSGSTLRWKLCANAHSWKMSLEHRVPLSHQDGG